MKAERELCSVRRVTHKRRCKLSTKRGNNRRILDERKDCVSMDKWEIFGKDSVNLEKKRKVNKRLRYTMRKLTMWDE